MTSLKRGHFLGHAELVEWLATANGKPSIPVKASDRFDAERQAAGKLGVPQWIVRVQEMHAGLQSAGLC